MDDFGAFLPLADEVGHRDLGDIRQQVLHEVLDFFVDDFVGDAEYFEAGADRAVYHELELHRLQVLDLIEVKDVEKDCTG